MRRLAFALLSVVCVACGSPTPSSAPSAAPPTPPTANPTANPTETPTAAPSASPTTRPTPTPIRTATPIPLASADQQILRVYCCSADPRTLWPQAASVSDELSIISATQRGLLYRDGQGNLVPALATDLPTVSDDGLTYTYHLREDARYSDGTPIVAADIVRAARALADPRNGFDYGYLMCRVAGANDVLGMDFGCPEGETPYADPVAGTFDDATVDGLLDQLDVTAPDDHTVVFQLNQPTSFWPDITAMAVLTPLPETQTSWAEAGDIVSSGPFMIDRWLHTSKIDLVPNPFWYGPTPTLQRIEIGIGGDPSAAVAAWEGGELDQIRVPTIDLPRVLATPEYASLVKRNSALSVEYYDFATCQTDDPGLRVICPPNEAVTKGVVGGSPMQNVHFRRGLTQAIDKGDFISSAFGGIGVPAYSPTMPGIPGFPTITQNDTPLPYDPTAALSELAIALDELGVAEPDPADVAAATADCNATCQHTKAWARMLGRMRFEYNCDAGHDDQVKYLADQWSEALGFASDQFDTRCTDYGGWPSRGPSGFFDVRRNGWSADFPHPDNQDRRPFACGMRDNESGYCNPDYDALLNEGAAASNYADSLPFYHQAEELLVEDAPALFVRYGESISLVRPWVINYVPSSGDHQNLGDTLPETIQIAAH